MCCLLFVEPQAVDLDHPGVHFTRLKLDMGHVQRKEPWLGPGSNHDARIRPEREERLDHFDVARRVAETMAGDVEDDRDHEIADFRFQIGADLQTSDLLKIER